MAVSQDNGQPSGAVVSTGHPLPREPGQRYRLGILQTHPIQYTAPWFRLLAERPEIDLTVYYCMLPEPALQGAGFGGSFNLDVPLLED